MRSQRLIALLCSTLILATGCATNFSARLVRSEIVRQTGEDPQKAFEMNVGRMTMSLAKRLAGTGSDPGGDLPLSGLTKFELAVYELSPSVGSGERRLDFTSMEFRGWEATVSYRDGAQSGMVLVRESGDSVGQLVLLYGGEQSATFVRLRGNLPRELPGVLAEAIKSGNTDAVERELKRLAQ